MIILNEKTICIWYIPLIPGKQDFLGSLFTNEENAFEFTYRFRYYHSNDPNDPKDKKSWYRLVAKPGESKEKLLTSIRVLINRLELVSGQKSDEIMYRGDYKVFFEEFKSKPWAHFSEQKIGEA